MFPPIQQLVADSAPVQALLGAKPRFTPWGESDYNIKEPYAVWQTVYGSPENFLAGVPNLDSWGVQVDVYGPNADVVRAVAAALRDTLEPHGYIVSWNGESRELDTKLYRYSFTIEFMTAR